MAIENSIVMFGNKYNKVIDPIIVASITNMLFSIWFKKGFVSPLN